MDLEGKLLLFVLGSSIAFASTLDAADLETDRLSLDTAGVRAGFGTESRAEAFHQAEAFLNSTCRGPSDSARIGAFNCVLILPQAG